MFHRDMPPSLSWILYVTNRKGWTREGIARSTKKQRHEQNGRLMLHLQCLPLLFASRYCFELNSLFIQWDIMAVVLGVFLFFSGLLQIHSISHFILNGVIRTGTQPVLLALFKMQAVPTSSTLLTAAIARVSLGSEVSSYLVEFFNTVANKILRRLFCTDLHVLSAMNPDKVLLCGRLQWGSESLSVVNFCCSPKAVKCVSTLAFFHQPLTCISVDFSFCFSSFDACGEEFITSRTAIPSPTRKQYLI